MQPGRRALACIVLVFSFTRIGLAVDRNWLTVAGGLYNSTLNWSTRTVPQAADNGIFDVAGATAYTVSLSSGTTSGGMIIRNDTVTLSLSALTLNITTGLTL